MIAWASRSARATWAGARATASGRLTLHGCDWVLKFVVASTDPVLPDRLRTALDNVTQQIPGILLQRSYNYSGLRLLPHIGMKIARLSGTRLGQSPPVRMYSARISTVRLQLQMRRPPEGYC